VSNHAHRRPLPVVDSPAPRKVGRLARLLGFGKTRRVTGPVAVGFVNSRVEAELLAGYLRNNGVRASVSADDEGGLSPALQISQRVRVLVAADQVARARQLMEEQS
jgi:hypothetical protein